MQDSQEFNVRFVRLVEIYPCLYDYTREDYQWSHAQERAWKNIANEIGEGVTIAECKNRWKNLRGNYTKHLKKYTPLGSSNKRPYYLAKYMTFISSFTKTRRPKGNDVTTNKNVGCIFDDDASVYMPDTQEASEYEKDKDEDTIQMDDNDETVSLCKESELSHDDLMASRPGTRHETLKSVSRSVRATSYNNDDADVHFLLSLLPDFRRMTDSQKLNFKIGILNLGATLMSNTFQPESVNDVSSVSPYTSRPVHLHKTSEVKTQGKELPETTISAPLRKKKRIEMSEAEETLLLEATKCLQESSSTNTIDPCVSFGSHVTNELRKYGPKTLMNVKHGISKIIFEADIRHFTKKE